MINQDIVGTAFKVKMCLEYLVVVTRMSHSYSELMLKVTYVRARYLFT